MKNTVFVLIGTFMILSFSCRKEVIDPGNPFVTGTVTDIEGNVYITVMIGDQWWMAENLKTTKYRNGDSIPNVTDTSEWLNLTTGAYCNYSNDTSHVRTFGRLYNWYAVSDSRGIAPSGWHVPSDEEWTRLTSFLGGDTLAGGKMKEPGTEHWVYPNSGATNESGFTALAGGYRFSYATGAYYGMGQYGNWWSSTAVDGYYPEAWPRELSYYNADVGRYNNDMKYGFSVRCVKD